MRIGVTGASGQLGRMVAEGVIERAGADAVVLVTRDPGKLADLAAGGAEVRAGDFDDRASLRTAFAGVDRLLLISTSVAGARVPGHLAAVEAATAAEVAHVAYTSMVNPSDDNPAFIASEHRATEEAIRAGGADWTFLRNGIYADLQVDGGLAAVGTGTLLSNAGSGGTTYVTRADCAAAAIAVLTTDGHAGKEYDITGPEALNAYDLAALYAEVSGRPVEVSDVDDDAWVVAMVGIGLPESAARIYVTFGASARQGYAAAVSSRVERLTGRPPTSMRELLEAHREQFALVQS